MASAELFIKVNTLVYKYTFHSPGIESKVSKTYNAYYVTALYGCRICYSALNKAHDTATHDHHDKEVTALRCFPAQPAYCQSKYTWPQRATE